MTAESTMMSILGSGCPNRPMTTRDVAREAGCSSQHAGVIMRRLIAKGLVRQAGELKMNNGGAPAKLYGLSSNGSDWVRLLDRRLESAEAHYSLCISDLPKNAFHTAEQYCWNWIAPTAGRQQPTVVH